MINLVFLLILVVRLAFTRITLFCFIPLLFIFFLPLFIFFPPLFIFFPPLPIFFFELLLVPVRSSRLLLDKGTFLNPPLNLAPSLPQRSTPGLISLLAFGGQLIQIKILIISISMFADTILSRFSDFLELVNVAELGVLEVPLAVSIFEVLVRV